MAARCSEACGFCGRCTASWEDEDRRDDDDYPSAANICDECHESIWFNRVTIAGVGQFCSRHCAAKAEQRRLSA